MARRIETLVDIAEALGELKRIDPRLAAVHAAAGEVPLRREPPGLAGLLRIVVGQQLSVQSARAIWGRLEPAIAQLEPGEVAALPDGTFAAAGLSRPKMRTVRAVCQAVADGLALEPLAEEPREAVHERLCAIRGIGPWTADIWLMFCAGHPDVFPVGDLALRQATARALLSEASGAPDRVAEEAERWRPYRSTAARLLWAWYGATRRGAEAVPV